MRRVLPMLALIVAVSACAAGQGKEKTNSTSKDKKASVAEGEAVSELGKSVVYVFQAKNNTYWFGSNDRGVSLTPALW